MFTLFYLIHIYTPKLRAYCLFSLEHYSHVICTKNKQPSSCNVIVYSIQIIVDTLKLILYFDLHHAPHIS